MSVERLADMSGEPLDITVARVLAVPPAKIWAAWLDSDILRRWWAPEPFETLDCVVEPRVGGQFVTIMRSPDGEEHVARGVFLELVEDERIVFTDALLEGFRPSGHGFFTAVVTLEPVDSGTRYTIRALHKDAADRRRHEEMNVVEHWGRCLDALEAIARDL